MSNRDTSRAMFFIVAELQGFYRVAIVLAEATVLYSYVF